MATSVVEVGGKEDRFKKYEDKIEKALSLALSYLQIEDSFLEVNLVSNEDIKELNKTYAGKDSPTNVLSFEEPGTIPWEGNELNHLGEIYLAPDEIEKREEDVVYLAIHGCLHLLGFNHKKEEEAKKMEKMESDILKNISEVE